MNIFLAGAVSVADKAQLNKYSTYIDILKKLKGVQMLTYPDVIWEYREKCINEHKDKTKLEKPYDDRFWFAKSETKRCYGLRHIYAVNWTWY